MDVVVDKRNVKVIIGTEFNKGVESMITKEEKELSVKINKRLDQLLTAVLAGGVGIQFDRKSAKLLLQLTDKINKGEVK